MENIVLVGPVSKADGGTYSNGVTSVINGLISSGFKYKDFIPSNKKSITYYLKLLDYKIYKIIPLLSRVEKLEIKAIGIFRVIKYIIIAIYINDNHRSKKVHVHDYYILKYLRVQYTLTTLHGFFGFKESHSKYPQWLFNYLYNIISKSNAIQFLTTKDKASFEKRYSGKYTPIVLPNGINSNQLCLRDNNVTKEIKLIMIGVIDSRKGQLRFIEEKGIPKQDEFIIIGDGPDKSKIENLIKINKSTNIKLLGFLSPRDVQKQLEKSNFLVVNSKSEGLPMVILEAMSKNCRILLNEDMKYLSNESYFKQLKDYFLNLETYINDRDTLVGKVFNANPDLKSLTWISIQIKLYGYI